MSGRSSAMVLSGGKVLTCDPAQPLTDAVAVEGGVVVALGDRARERAGQVVDMGGGCLVPGFRDGHVHPLQGGVELLGPPIEGAGSVDELVARLGAWAGEHPETGWIVGGGYNPTIQPRGLFDAALLDAVVPDRPVVLHSTDGHARWANSAALAAAGIGPGTPDPPRGRIVRRPDGSPLGTLQEDAGSLVDDLAPTPTPEAFAEGLRTALARFSAAGVVWVQEASLEPEELVHYLDAAARGDLTCRVNAALRADPESWRGQRDAFADARARAEGDGMVSARTVKFFADGVIEGGTGLLLEPYADEPDQLGLGMWPADELVEAVQAFDADGFQVHIHAIGDGAVRNALDAVEHTIAASGPRDRRPVIAHTQLVHPDDLPRFANLGVIANFEPLWATLDPCMVELTLDRLGPERSAWQYPIGSLWRSGAHVSFGSDWSVSSLRPLDGIAVAVSRQTAKGEPAGGWLPAERLPLHAALSAYTSGTAWQAFEEQQAGTIAVGKRADLCLLGADPEMVEGASLGEVPVVGTWLDGAEVFRG